MSLPKTLRLSAWAPVLNGDGAELELVVEAFKRKGTYPDEWNWRGVVKIELDRNFIRKFQEQVAAMQTRDRARLAREAARLDTEVAPVQIANTKETT